MFQVTVDKHEYDASKTLLHLAWQVPVGSGWQNSDMLVEVSYSVTVQTIEAIREEIKRQTDATVISFTSITVLREGVSSPHQSMLSSL